MTVHLSGPWLGRGSMVVAGHYHFCVSVLGYGRGGEWGGRRILRPHHHKTSMVSELGEFTAQRRGSHSASI